MRMKYVALIACLFLALSSVTAFAAISDKVAIQGRLTNSTGSLITSNLDFTFKIYNDSSAGTLLFTENWNASTACGQVNVQQGIFNAYLGTCSDPGPALSSLLFDEPYWLDITINGSALTPRHRISSSAYGFRANITEFLGGTETKATVNLNMNDKNITSISWLNDLMQFVTGGINLTTNFIKAGWVNATDVNVSNNLCLGGTCLAVWPSAISQLPAGNISNGTFGSNIADTGNYGFPADLSMVGSLVTSNNISIGPSAGMATGDTALAIGWDASAIGSYASALGKSANASGQSSTAIGHGTKAGSIYSTAVGYNSKAASDNAIAVGSTANALGSKSAAFGILANASGASSLALGGNAYAIADYSVVINTGSDPSKNLTNNVASSFMIGSQGTNVFFINGSGYVGIGTSSPANKFEVAGDINASSGSLIFYNELMPDGATCSDGQTLNRTSANTWACANFPSASGDITDVLAGFGITVDNSGGPQPRVNLSSSSAGDALTYSAGVLNVANGTGLEINSDTIRIADGGVTNAKIAANAVNTTQIIDGTILAADLTSDLGLGWANLTTYPAGCSAGQAVRIINDTLTCIDVPSAVTQLPAGNISNGTFGSNIADTGNYKFPADLNVSGNIYAMNITLGSSTSFINGTHAGIGTATPTTKLQINSTNGSAYGGGIINDPGLIIDSGLADGDGSYAHNGITFVGDAGNKAFIYQIHDDNADSKLVLGSNNTERIRIVSTGRVGIGSTNPNSLVEINGTGGDWSSNLGFKRIVASKVYDSRIAVAADGLLFRNFNATTNDNVSFAFRNSADTNIVTMMGGGNVGINDTLPNATLEVAGSVGITSNGGLPTDTAYGLFMAGNYTSPVAGRIFVGDGSGWKLYFSQRASSVNTDLVTIEDSGDVGIGTTSPTNKFVINRSATTNNTVGTYHMLIETDGTDLLTLGADANNAYIQSWAGKPLVINGQGNNVSFPNANTLVTIGTSTPYYGFQLTTEGDSGLGYTAMFRTGASSSGAALGTSGTAGWVQGLTSGGGAANLTLNGNGGYVGIGTNAPVSNLHVYGTDAEVLVEYSGSSRGGLRAMSSQRIAFLTTTSNDELVFGSENGMKGTFTEVMRIDNGNSRVGIGTTAPQSRLDMGSYGSANTISWGGATGTAWIATIGSASSSGALSMMYISKFNATAGSEQYLTSYPGTYSPSIVRAYEGIQFIVAPSLNRAADTVIDFNAYTRMKVMNTGDVNITTGSLIFGGGNISIGTGVTAAHANATVIGRDSDSTGVFAVVIGHNATGGSSDVAIGKNALVDASGSGDYAGTAIGRDAWARYEGTAIGYGAQAAGQSEATAIGWQTRSYGTGSIAIGPSATAGMDGNFYAIAIGAHSFSNAYDSIAIGDWSNATDQGAVAFGAFTNATGYSAYAIGANAKATAAAAFAIGASSTNSNNYSVAIGDATANLFVDFETNRVGVNTRTPVKTVDIVGDLNVTGSIWQGVTQGGAADHVVDIAEYIKAKDVEAGDVAIIDPENNATVIKSFKSYDSSVAGVVSTSPAFVIAARPDGVPLALAGRVPTKVSTENGPIARGDLLTTSNTPGHAMKCEERTKCAGAIIGKALEPLESGKGKIMILITMM